MELGTEGEFQKVKMLTWFPIAGYLEILDKKPDLLTQFSPLTAKLHFVSVIWI